MYITCIVRTEAIWTSSSVLVPLATERFTLRVNNAWTVRRFVPITTGAWRQRCERWVTQVKGTGLPGWPAFPPAALLPLRDTSIRALPGVCLFCRNLTKIFWVSHFVEFILGRFSHFNIAIAYSNSKFCGAWTPSICEFTCNFSKASTPLSWWYGKIDENVPIHRLHGLNISLISTNVCFRPSFLLKQMCISLKYFKTDNLHRSILHIIAHTAQINSVNSINSTRI